MSKLFAVLFVVLLATPVAAAPAPNAVVADIMSFVKDGDAIEADYVGEDAKTYHISCRWSEGALLVNSTVDGATTVIMIEDGAITSSSVDNGLDTVDITTNDALDRLSLVLTAMQTIQVADAPMP